MCNFHLQSSKFNIQLVNVKEVLSSSPANSTSCSEASTEHTDYTQHMTYARKIKWLLFMLM